MFLVYYKCDYIQRFSLFPSLKLLVPIACSLNSIRLDLWIGIHLIVRNHVLTKRVKQFFVKVQ